MANPMSTSPYYVYLWLRTDGTPYYVGKGKGNRAFNLHRKDKPPADRNRIRMFPMPDEDTAYAYEIYFIDFYGRKDTGTGILHNRTDGGDKPPKSRKGQKHTGHPHSEKTRLKISDARLRNPSRGMTGKKQSD